MKRIAFYGGSFDPLHNGHLRIAQSLTGIFALDEFVFIPAFHAPHKKEKKPTSAFHRHAMLALATAGEEKLTISTLELDLPERPYTFETLTRLKGELADTRIFFVMGADSWRDITTWFRWEDVLTMTDIIVMTRPGYEIAFDHVTDGVRERIVDLRGDKSFDTGSGTGIFITDAVQADISATEVRRRIREDDAQWREDVPLAVANYIEKYEVYK